MTKMLLPFKPRRNNTRTAIRGHRQDLDTMGKSVEFFTNIHIGEYCTFQKLKHGRVRRPALFSIYEYSTMATVRSFSALQVGLPPVPSIATYLLIQLGYEVALSTPCVSLARVNPVLMQTSGGTYGPYFEASCVTACAMMHRVREDSHPGGAYSFCEGFHSTTQSALAEHSGGKFNICNRAELLLTHLYCLSLHGDRPLPHVLHLLYIRTGRSALVGKQMLEE